MLLLEARKGAFWDAGKIGLSPPPLETSEGWLIIYHGVRHTPAGAIYRLGLALLDRDDPCVILRRGEEWVFGPEEPYELMGDVPNVVFLYGVVVDGATDELRMGHLSDVKWSAPGSLPRDVQGNLFGACGVCGCPELTDIHDKG